MKTTYFKIIARKIEDKIILMAVVPDDFLGKEIAGDVEIEAFKLPPNIYTGTYPNIRINTDTIQPTKKHIGQSPDGIFTQPNWAIIEKEEADNFGIGL
ncbi:hypothetical protein [Chishuiella sp.]|uniref:hypothetical protein n=1 Tax=Chishuiella sp. TaxID=1969467 RepID=UPI0028AE536A|nr:hypothetical protein [Chishuiella sp.]